MYRQSYRQSAFDKWPLDGGSVQAIITSPPYWSLRKYDIEDIVIGEDKDCTHKWASINSLSRGGKHGNSAQVGSTRKDEANMRGYCYMQSVCTLCGAHHGQYGLEPDYRDYVAHTVLWAKEAWRVLRDDGVFFLNIADTYKGNGGASRHYGYSDSKYPEGRRGEFAEPAAYPQGNIRAKSQMLIPHRVAMALIDDGWILRNTIIWYKPNAMPESVRDRFSKKYEYIFMFCKSERYKFDLDVIREPIKIASSKKESGEVSNNHKWLYGTDGQSSHTMNKPRLNRNTKISKEDTELFGSPRARYYRENNNANTGENNKEPYKKNNPHLMRIKSIYREDNILLGLNPNGKNPGDVWNPPVDSKNSDFWAINTQPSSERHFAMWPERLVERMILCSTDAGDIVLDPFCGSGTTLRVAERFGRIGIGIDLGYKEIQEKRLLNIQRTLLYAL